MIKGNWETKVVTINDNQLDLEKSLDVVNHSPTGFNWGYAGSGPSQLALGLLLEFMPSRKETALSIYQQFKFDVISKLPQENFELKEDVVLDWINLHAKEKQNQN